MERHQIYHAKIPDSAIAAFRVLSRSEFLEPLIAPRFAASFKTFLDSVAKTVAQRYPKRSGRSANEITMSARVRGGRRTLDSIDGYFLVSPQIYRNEFGARIRPSKSQKLAIPFGFAVWPNGSPKRRGPLSWKALGTFVYKSKRTGKEYIAYKTKGRGLVVLYVLVDEVVIKGTKRFPTAWNANIPSLYASWMAIMQEEINFVYDRAYAEQLKLVRPGMTLPRLPSRVPQASNYVPRMIPRFK
jgi:hypothetical protein